MQHFDRRKFLKTATAAVAIAGLPSWVSSCEAGIKNKLPRWRGFNILDFFSPRAITGTRFAATEQDFQWMVDWGFDFVRFPIAYPGYLKYNPAAEIPITPEQTVDFNEEAIEIIEKTVYAANKQGLHVSLNLHRAPGFCINAGFREPFNLWKDAEAQQAFYTHWDMWAKRFKNVSPKLLSFDLVNEPCYKEDMNDQYCPSTAIPGEIYRKVAKGCLEVIHRQNPNRLVVADGNHGGSLVTPELEDNIHGNFVRWVNPPVRV
jgi:aryl-phospho-beta-D-glucosidase BglC (GH1 family)